LLLTFAAIGCDSNETNAKKDHPECAFQSHLKQGLVETIYLSASFNEFDENGPGNLKKRLQISLICVAVAFVF
jgi:hypothetical protein